MDAETIRRMAAGPEMDDAIARAMGWGYQPRFDGDVDGYWLAPDGTRYISEELPGFSESWEGAGIVLEFMRQQHATPNLYAEVPGDAWVCYLRKPEDWIQPWAVYGTDPDSGPLAIGRAALLWKLETPV
jgi:hypothetical protein